MNNSFYALAFRMKYINRWGLMHSSRNETLSEHCADTAVLAHALAIIGNKFFGKNYNADRVMTLAMFHDMCEVYTGDMPTPVKYSSEEMRTAYKEIERLSCEKLISKLPDELKSDYAEILNPKGKDAEYKKLVKAADKLSALLKCIEELHNGNPEFSGAYESTKKSIDSNECEELKYFIDNFLDSFTLTLDEM